MIEEAESSYGPYISRYLIWWYNSYNVVTVVNHPNDGSSFLTKVLVCIINQSMQIQ